jgi:hypothetical protein
LMQLEGIHVDEEIQQLLRIGTIGSTRDTSCRPGRV